MPGLTIPPQLKKMAVLIENSTWALIDHQFDIADS